MQITEIPWPDAATLAWDGPEVVDVTTGRRGSLVGSLTSSLFFTPYKFDRAVGLRSHGVHWAVAYANRNTKAVLMKNGSIHRELNRSYYCAQSYDFPVTLGTFAGDRVIVVHCPHSFDLLEMEDAETGVVLDSLKSRDMEFHSRLSLSQNGQHLIDAGWFWHPWCGAVVFEIEQGEDGSLRFAKAMPSPSRFSAQDQIDSIAFMENTHLVVSSAPDYSGEEPRPGSLLPKQLGVWSLAARKWESAVELSEPTGMLMPWKEWVVSFYNHPKLIELATGKIVHQWEKIYSGKQVGPIELGDPPPPPIALDPLNGRFAVGDSKTVTLVSL